MRYVWVLDDSVYENTTEVDYSGDDASILRSWEERLQEDNLAKDSLTIQPEEDPDVEWLWVLNNTDEKDAPGAGGNHCIDEGVEDKPR